MIRIPSNMTHRINDGDTLYSLSWRYYGTSAGVAWIWLENYDLVGDDPDNLPCGAEIVIPALETVDKQVRFTRSVRMGETLAHIKDTRFRKAATMYGASWPVQVLKVLSLNGGAGTRPEPGQSGIMPARGKGYPLEQAERWRREAG
jgi:phage tail protein X